MKDVLRQSWLSGFGVGLAHTENVQNLAGSRLERQETITRTGRGARLAMLPLLEPYEDVKSSVLPTLAARVVLRVPTIADRARIEQWFHLGDLDLTWGGLRENLEFVAKPPADGGQRVIAVDGELVGYLRWSPLAESWLRQPMLSRVLKGRAVRIDALVGPRDWRFVGVGGVALRRAREELSAAGVVGNYVGLASIRQLAARRAYENAGFYHHFLFDEERLGPLVALVRPGG